MNKYYHYTKKENIPQILETKVLKNKGWGVFACETIEDTCKFISFYHNNEKFKLDEIVIIEFETDAEFEESFDHYAPAFNNARAVMHVGDDVPLRNIKLLNVFRK